MNILSPEDATLAARVFQLISEGRLEAARTTIDEELLRRQPIPEELIARVIALYNSIGLPKMQKLTVPRKRALCARLREQSNPMWWHGYFQRVKRSDFLMGRKAGVSWSATFDWLMKPANMVKVVEGNYDPKGGGIGFDAGDEATYRLSNAALRSRELQDTITE
jgi:hypothetical protein